MQGSLRTPTALVALCAGLLTSLLVAGFPASAADTSIAATPLNTWQPADIQINPGDTVTWSNPSSGFHNVCVAHAGSNTCSSADHEFRNGDVGTDWSGYTNSFKFDTEGTYKYFCEQHASLGMKGTITVGSGGGTTTSDTTTSQTTTTQTQTQTTTTQTGTQTVPTGGTQTDTTGASADTTAPSFTGAVRRKASRKSLILLVRSSEDADLKATVFRRAPRARSFSRVGAASVPVDAGRNTVRLPRKAAGRLRRGAYRVKLVLIDAAGNRSAVRTLVFKLA